MKRLSIPQLGLHIFLYSLIPYVITFLLSFCYFSFEIANIAVHAVYQCVSIFLFCSISYLNVWREGSADNNRVRIGSFCQDRCKGLKAGLLASLPAFAAFLYLVLARVGVLAQTIRGIDVFFLYKLCNAHILLVLNGFGTHITDLSLWSLCSIGVLTLILPISSAIAYWCGYKRFSIWETLFYSHPKA